MAVDFMRLWGARELALQEFAKDHLSWAADGTAAEDHMKVPEATATPEIRATPISDLSVLEDSWRCLDEQGTHSFFLSWTWIGTWLRSLPDLSRVFLLEALDGVDLRGMAILTIRQDWRYHALPTKQGHLNSTGDPALDCIMIEHNGFASDPGWADRNHTSLLRWFSSQSLGINEISLPGISVGQANFPPQEAIAADHMQPAYRIPLSLIDYRYGLEPLLSRNARQQLRRSIRAYESEGTLTLEIAPDVETAVRYFSELRDFHIRWWTRRGQRHAFSSRFFEVFHQRLLRTGTIEKNVDILRVAVAGRPIGYLYNFRRNDTVFSYQSGFNDVAAGLRPGYVCHALAASHYAKNGLRYYDFLAGRNQLKQSFGTDRYELRWQRLRRPSIGFSAERFARGLLRSD